MKCQGKSLMMDGYHFHGGELCLIIICDRTTVGARVDVVDEVDLVDGVGSIVSGKFTKHTASTLSTKSAASTQSTEFLCNGF
jgi:hypothetical protein